MTRFVQWVWALPLVIILPAIVIAAFTYERRSRATRLARFGSSEMLARLAPFTMRRGAVRILCVMIAFALLGISFAGPRWGLSDTVVRTEGVDVVIALDASLSMLATDDKPSRLDRMTQVAKQLYSISPSDQFALLAFAGRSYILTPLTSDAGALGLYLDNLDPSVVGQAGSSLSSTIRQATNLLRAAGQEGDKAIILMTDGEAFEDNENIMSEARKAGQAGIEVITVGFGTEEGSTIPIIENGIETQKRDVEGRVVVTRYSADLLRRVAEEAGGVFIGAQVSDKAQQIRIALNQLKTHPRSIITGRDFNPQYQWFLIAAFILIYLDVILASRPRLRQRAGAASGLLIVILTLACFSDRDPENKRRYNHGTDMLHADSLIAGRELLDSAILSADSAIQFRSAFNSGWGYLVDGLGFDPGSNFYQNADSLRPDASGLLDSALARYRVALIRSPDDPDAKWNYELALRNNDGGGGGGGGESDESPSSGSGPAAPSTPGPSSGSAGGISEQQAGAILDNAEREERDVQGKRQRRNVPQPPPTGKDW